MPKACLNLHWSVHMYTVKSLSSNLAELDQTQLQLVPLNPVTNHIEQGKTMLNRDILNRMAVFFGKVGNLFYIGDCPLSLKK